MSKNIKYRIYFLVFVTLSIVIGEYVKNRRLTLLSRNPKKTLAIYDSYTVVRNTGPISYFYFKIKKDEKILLEDMISFKKETQF